MPIRTVYICDKCGFQIFKARGDSVFDLVKYWTVKEDGTVYCPTCIEETNSETPIIPKKYYRRGNES